MSDKDQNKESENKNGNGRAPQVGALLRASRLRVGEDLRNVSDVLCIRYLYLEAIEECRYADLPGNTYAVGFIRSYAEHLGLDGDEVVRRYRVEQTGGKSATDLAFPTPVQDSGVPKGAIVFIGVLIALLVYGGWYVTTTDESILSDLISPVPDHLKQLVTGDDVPRDADAAAPTTTQGETPPAAVTESATKEIEKVVRETTAAAEQMASDAGAAAQRTAAAAAEAADSAAEATAESASEVAAAVTETAQSAIETTNEVVQSVTETTTEALQPAETTSVEATPEVNRNEPATGPQQTVAPETSAPTLQASSDAQSEMVQPGTSAAETSVIETPVNAPETMEPATAESASAVEQAATSTAETTSVEQQPTDIGVPGSEAEPAPVSPATSEVTAEDLNALVLRQATAPAPPETASLTSGDTAATSGIAIRATSSSWVEIKNLTNGDIVFTGLMNAGSVFNVPDMEGLTLDTGNAGALDITVDGAAVPKIGGVGAVRKNVLLNADRLKAGTAANR